MKPKPFESLNHFTVPVVRIVSLLLAVCRVTVRSFPYGQHNVFRDLAHDGVPHSAADPQRNKKRPARIRQAPETTERVHAHGRVCGLSQRSGRPVTRQATSPCNERRVGKPLSDEIGCRIRLSIVTVDAPLPMLPIHGVRTIHTLTHGTG